MQTFEIHYYLDKNNHLIDAYTRNKCESLFLEIMKELSAQFDLEVDWYSLPSREGGYRDFWYGIPKYKEHFETISIIILLATHLFSCASDLVDDNRREDVEVETLMIKRERERVGLEKDKIELDLLKEAYEQREQIRKKYAEEIEGLSKNTVLNTKRSNFYKEIQSQGQILKVGYAYSDLDKQIISSERIVERENFKKFIQINNNPEKLYINNAYIKVIAPVLSDSKAKWRGEYDGKVITFSMNDINFKSKVIKKQVSFKSGSYIQCELEVLNKFNEQGVITSSIYSVDFVSEYHEEGAFDGSAVMGVKHISKQEQLF